MKLLARFRCSSCHHHPRQRPVQTRALDEIQTLCTPSVNQVAGRQPGMRIKEICRIKKEMYLGSKQLFGLNKNDPAILVTSSLLDSRLPLELEKCQQSQGSWGSGSGSSYLSSLLDSAPYCILRSVNITGIVGVGVEIPVTVVPLGPLDPLGV